ncbi:MAG: DUF2125 domain-containing protein [Pseudomonadota bacterium]
MAQRSRSAIKNIRRADQRRQTETEQSNGGSKDWNQARNQRKVMWFGGSIAFVVVALTGAWFFVASQVGSLVERELEALNTPQQTLTCAGQDIVGFPFRLGLRCEQVEFASEPDGLVVQAGTLLTAAQVYAPRHQIIELKSPVRIETPRSFPMVIDWDSARSSVRINSSNALQRFVLEIANVSASTALPDAPARKLISLTKLFSVAEPFAFEGQEEANDLRMFVQADAIVPSGITMPPFNFEGTIALDNGTELLADPDQWLAALPQLREPIQLEGVTLRTGNMRIELSGRLSVNGAGLLNGTIRMAGQGLEDGLTALQQGIDPRATELKQTLDTLVPTILALAQPDADNPNIRNAPPIIIRDGRVVLGLLPLGEIPPLRFGN